MQVNDWLFDLRRDLEAYERKNSPPILKAEIIHLDRAWNKDQEENQAKG